MNNKQSHARFQIKKKRDFLLSCAGDRLLTDLLSSTTCQEIIKKGGSHHRNRIYNPFKTLLTFVKQVLHSDKSCQNAVFGVVSECLSTNKQRVSSNTVGYSQARQRLPEEVVSELVTTVGAQALKEAKPTWKPYGRDLKVFDGTTVSIPDTAANKGLYPKHSNQKKEVGFPLVRLVAVMSLTTGSVINYAMSACKGKSTGETSLLRTILDSLEENDIAVGDRCYCNYFLTADLTKKGVDFIVHGHKQRRYDFRLGKKLGKKDHVTVWNKPNKPKWMSEEDYQQYPKQLAIREFKVSGCIYMTTLLEAKTYHKDELAKLYQRRWEVELNLNNIKTTMSMDRLSCKTPSMIEKEIGIHLLAYNLIRSLMVSASVEHNQLPWQISFKATVQLFV